MTEAFRTVGIIGKPGDARVAETVERLLAMLRPLDIEVLCDRDSAAPLAGADFEVADRTTLGKRCDLVVVVAGDGTFLSAARSLVDHDVPLLGVNLGRLGFLADVMPAEMTERLRDVLRGDFDEEQRFLLHTRVLRAERAVSEGDALNEVVAHKWNVARLIQFETFIDGHLVNSQRSDGIIVATPTGSTAYALSGGGPILHPGLEAIVVVPICPHTLSNRPLVVSANSCIEIHVKAGDDPEARITWDGQISEPIGPGDRIDICRKERPLRLIHPRGYDYYATLRAKLHWAREL